MTRFCKAAIAICFLLATALPGHVAVAREYREGECTNENPAFENLGVNKRITQHEAWLKGAKGAKEGTYQEGTPAFLSACKTNLWNFNAPGAQLWGADLRYAFIKGSKDKPVNLTNADFSFANMHDIRMEFVDLTGATFKSTNLNNVNFSGKVDMTNVKFDVTDADDWRPQSFEHIVGLRTMRYEIEGSGLHSLRDQTRKYRFLAQTRDLTYAIWSSDEDIWAKRFREDGLSGSFFYLGFFEFIRLVNDYGLSMWRPWIILICAVLVFSLPYMLATGSRRSSVWGLYKEPRKDGGAAGASPSRIREHTPEQFWPKYRLALWFSLLTIFDWGWRDLNISHWLARAQSEDYVLVTTGWLRPLATLQRLLGLALVAISISFLELGLFLP